MKSPDPDTVFVSSTYEDLAAHRRAVWSVLERFDVNVRGMEQFGARPEAPLETCLAEVEQSDIYVGIVAYRLGSVDYNSEKSFTQLEYEHARRLKKHILIYVIDEAEAKVTIGTIELDPKPREKLESFKRTLRQNHTVGSFTSPEDLAEKLKRDFDRLLKAKDTDTETPVADEELAATMAVLNSFRLLPKALSGKEVRVRFAPKGTPYPASRDICDAFNLPYGSTLGLRIAIQTPDAEVAKDFDELYASSERAQELLALIEQVPCDVYVRLQFSPTPVDKTKAQFFGETYHTVSLDPSWGTSTSSLLGQVKTHHVPAEGKLILLFTKVPA